ncbi:HAMP domain-containing sensor histidine kinase [Crassaminicella thermophila]|nr:ATP-binding protein [Crassaminicella thermophila]
MEQKKESLIKYSEKIKSMYDNNMEDIENELARIENILGGNITILKVDGEYLYISSFGYGRGGRKGQNIPLTREGIERVLSGEGILETFYHPKFHVKLLVYAAPLTKDSILVLQTSIGAIEESVEIAKNFYIYIGIISCIIGTIIAFWYANRFTKPIIKLNHVAKSMANLDFSKKYEVHSNDEIGQLGETMNDLSNKLDCAITQLNEANRKLKEDIEKERKIDLLRKEFISSVSHELKTPIALIQGYAEGLMDDVAGDEESKSFYCEVIMDEAEKMGKLVKDLLELSKMESGNVSFEMKVFDIITLVEKVYAKYKPIFKEKSIDVYIDKEDKEIKVKGDPLKIEQVLVNFINNGIHHIGGERKIYISIRNEDEKVRLGIKNTGEPIPEEEIHRIWDSFYKIDKSRAREYGGTGLGLSIVKGILKFHGSSFGVLNQEDGVEFWFELRKGE